MKLFLFVLLSWYGVAFLETKVSSVRGLTSLASLNRVNEDSPLLLRAAQGLQVERTPVWMMRQAGRHIKAYRDLCIEHKTFRDRSENVDVATEIRFVFVILYCCFSVSLVL